MKEAVGRRLHSDLKGITVVVHGLGSIGQELCSHLSRAGAQLIVGELDPVVEKRVAERHGARIVPLDRIAEEHCEVYAPCAPGWILSGRTLRRIRASVVCGSADNVVDESGAQILHEMGKLHAPDFVANAGGTISAFGRYLGWHERDIAAKIDGIAERLGMAFDKSSRLGAPPLTAAKELAAQKLAAFQQDPPLRTSSVADRQSAAKMRSACSCRQINRSGM